MKKIKQFENAFPDGLKSIKINEDFSIDVDGSVNFFSWRLKEIPFQFKNVAGRFWCNNNELTSLKGSPERIGGSFSCGDNNFTSLKYAPKYIGGDFSCNNCPILTLEGAPEIIDGDFSCHSNSNHFTSLKGIGIVKGFIYTNCFKGYLREYRGEL